MKKLTTDKSSSRIVGTFSKSTPKFQKLREKKKKMIENDEKLQNGWRKQTRKNDKNLKKINASTNLFTADR